MEKQLNMTDRLEIVHRSIQMHLQTLESGYVRVIVNKEVIYENE